MGPAVELKATGAALEGRIPDASDQFVQHVLGWHGDGIQAAASRATVRRPGPNVAW